MSMSLKHIQASLLSAIVMLMFAIDLTGQTQSIFIYNTKTAITITDNAKLYIIGGEYYHNQLTGNEARIAITGELIIDKGLTFKHSGSSKHELFLFNQEDTNGFGKVHINGGEIAGDSPILFGNLRLSSGSKVTLSNDIIVYRNLELSSGNLDLNAQKLSLFKEDGALGLFQADITNETENTYIYDSQLGGTIATNFKKPFNVLSYKPPGALKKQPNTTFGNVGAIVGTSNYAQGIEISRVYGVQYIDNSFNKYFLIKPSGTITDPKLTLNYFNRDKPASSTPANYRIFRAATDANTNYTPAITAVDAGLKKVETTKADITAVAQRYVIGECLTEPTVDLEKKYSICTNDKPYELNAKYADHNAKTSYQWYKNDMPLVGEVNKKYLLNKTDNYAVLVTNTTTGCFNYHEFDAYVNPSPDSKFSFPTVKCEDTPIQFTNETNPTGKYKSTSWDFDTLNPGVLTDFKSSNTRQDGSITFTAYGNYWVRLIMESDSNCLDTISKDVRIDVKPTAIISSTDFAKCEGETFVLNNTSTPVDSINKSVWKINGTNQATLSYPNQKDPISFSRTASSGPGNLLETVLLKVTTNRGCRNNTTETITVQPLPYAIPTLVINPARTPIKFCIDTLVDFKVASVRNTVSYNWDFGQVLTNTNNSAKRSLANPTAIKYALSGNYTAQAQLTSNLGCQKSFSITNIVVHPLPVPNFSITEDTVCYGTSVQLTNTKQFGATYNWNFGDASTSNSQGTVVSKSYATSGVFNIKLNAESQFGCKSDSTKVVRIKPMPAVSFTVNDKCEDSTVTFTATVNSTPVGAPALNTPTYHWDFGETNTNANQNAKRSVNNPIIAYSKHSGAGSYSPKFYVVAEKCTSSTASNTIKIFPNPVAAFTGGNNCSGDQIGFTNISTIGSPSVNSYNWDMGDGNTSLTHAGSFNYSYSSKTSANYTVRLKATSNNGCIDTTSAIIKNYALPTANFTDSLATKCLDSTSTFINLSSMSDGSNMTFNWLFNDGNSSTLQTPNHVYTADGLYNVKLTVAPADVANPCRSDTTIAVVIYPLPQTSFTFTDNCADDSIRFTNTTSITSGTLTYKWNFTSGASDTAITASSFKYSYTTPDTNNVTLEATSSKGCPISKTQAVRFYPYVNVDFDSAKASVCIFNTSSFDNTSHLSSKETWKYYWDFGNGEISTLKNPFNKYFPKTAGFGIDSAYTVRLKITPTDTTNVCEDSVGKVIYIHPLPDSSFNITLDTFCLGVKTSFIKNTAQNLHTYHWDFGDGTTDSNTTFSQHIYLNNGGFTPKLTSISEYNCVSSDTQNVFVLAVPKPNFIIVRDTVCSKDSIVLIDSSDNVANIYVWNFGDGSANDSLRSRGDTITRVYAKANTYTVSLTGIKGECFSVVKKTLRIEPDPVVQFALVRDNKNGKKVDITNRSYLPNGSNGTLNFDWNFGDGTSDTTKLNFFNHVYTASGKYGVTLKATSNFGCFNSKIDSIETVNTPSSTFTVSRNYVCKGDTFSFSNSSTNAQSYFWNFGDGTTSASTTPNHKYTQSGKFLVQLIAKDTNNYSDTSSQLITINAIPIIQFSSTTNICAGDQAVFTNNSFIQSSDTLRYKWNFGDGDTSLEASPFHRYDTGSSYQAQLIVTSASECVDTLTKTVNIYSGPIAKFDTSSARSCAGTLSSLTNQTTIATGETISSYLWRLQGIPSQPTSQNTSVTYGTAGRYNVELVARSTRGCKDSVTYAIVIDSVPALNFGGTQNTCGTTLTLDAKNPGANYSWSTGATSKTITVSSSATYKVTVTLPGSSSCQTSDSVIVNLNTLVNPNLGNDFSACGDTVLDAKNPGSTYNWTWAGGSSTNRTVNVSSSKTYYVTVTDQNSCIGEDSIIATITAPPVVALGVDINVCAGSAVTLDAGNIGKKFIWSNSDTSQTISNPVTGFYIVTVKDTSTLCSTNDSVNVTYKPAPSFTLGTDKTVCGAQSVLLNAGPLTNGSFLWSDNSSLQTLAVGKNGKYWVKLTDNGNSCSTTDTINVLINPLPSLALTASMNECAGSSIVLKPITSNAANYTYNWNNSSTDSVLSPVATGLYSVTVTNSTTLCNKIASSNITINPSPTVNLGNDTNLCGGSSLLLSVGSSSYSTLWSNNSTSPAISVKTPGTYSVVATQSGCSTRDTLKITSTARPIVNIGNSSSICSNDTLNIDAGNVGSTFKWNDNSTNQIRKVTTSGFYDVTVTDVNGCSGAGNVNVQSFTAPTLNLGSNDTVCQGETVILDAKNPGATYSWSNASTSQAVQIAVANTYKVTVTNQNNCSVTDSVIISYITKPTVNLGGNINLCSGIKDTLDAGNPGLKYNWSTGDTTKKLIVTVAGTYRVTVSEGTCSAKSQVVASVRAIPNVNLGIDKIGCIGDSISLSSLNNYPSGTLYSWSSTSTNRSIKAATTGIYVLTVTDANNCKNLDSINVNIKAIPAVNLPSTISACGFTQLDAGNTGATYAWNTNAASQTISARQSGTYVVSVYVSSCVTKDTSVVTINALPVVNLGSDVSACVNNAPVFNAGHIGKKYLWKSGDTVQTYTPAISDTLWVRVTDNLGCSGTDTVSINFNAGVQVALGNDMDSCHYQDIVLDAQNPGNRFIWSTGKRTQKISVDQTAAYSVTVTDSKNCSSSDAINVTLKTIPVVNLGNDRDVCDSISLDGQNSGSTYLWSNNSTDQKLLVQTAGSYSVKVTNVKSCIARDTVVLGIKATPIVNLGPDTNICSGNAITLNANNSGNTILWSNNTTNQNMSVASLGTYWLKVTNSLGCSKTDSIQVTLGATPTIDIGADTGFCINQVLALDAGNPGASYIWGGPNKYSDTAQISNISNAGKYYVQVTTAGGCIGSDTMNLTPKTDTVYAYFLSTSKVEIGDTVQFVDLSYPDITSWNYDFGDLSTSSLQDPEHRYFVNGKYNVKLTVSNGSCQDSRTKVIDVSQRLKQEGFNPNAPDKEIEPTQFVKSNLYPNPSQGSFRLLFELSQEDNVAIYFFDMRGTILHQEFLEGVDSYVNDFHFNNLAPGMYFMQANLGRERKIFRVVITR